MQVGDFNVLQTNGVFLERATLIWVSGLHVILSWREHYLQVWR